MCQGDSLSFSGGRQVSGVEGDPGGGPGAWRVEASHALNKVATYSSCWPVGSNASLGLFNHDVRNDVFQLSS